MSPLPQGMAAASVLLALLVGAVDAQHDPAGYVYTQHALRHPYSDTGFDIPHWNFQGSTALTDQVIRLTPDRQSKKGNLWNTVPWNPPRDDGKAYFEIIMEIHVNGQGTKLYGDGFAFWFTDKMYPLGNVFGSADFFKGMGIFFDTYSNVNQGHSQYISVIFGDGEIGYDHDKDGGDAKLAGCQGDFRGQKMDVKISYDNDILRLFTGKPNEAWEECFVVRRVKLPRGYFFGLSAATGELADNHDIISFKVTDPAPMTEEEQMELQSRIQKDVELGVETEVHHDPQYETPAREEMGKPIPLWMSLSAIGVVIVVVGVLVYTGQKKTEYHAKHFT